MRWRKKRWTMRWRMRMRREKREKREKRENGIQESSFSSETRSQGLDSVGEKEKEKEI